MLQSLHFLTRIFLESVPACVHCPHLFLSLATLFLLTTPKTAELSSGLNKLPSEAPVAVRKHVKTEYLKAIQSLKRVK